MSKNTIEILELDIRDDNLLQKEIKRKHKTSEYMTRYEYTRLLAARIIQLQAGAKPKIDVSGIYDLHKIAETELHQRVIPLLIVRKLPDGSVDKWDIRDMHIRDY